MKSLRWGGLGQEVGLQSGTRARDPTRDGLDPENESDADIATVRGPRSGRRLGKTGRVDKEHGGIDEKEKTLRGGSVMTGPGFLVIGGGTVAGAPGCSFSLSVASSGVKGDRLRHGVELRQ